MLYSMLHQLQKRASLADGCIESKNLIMLQKQHHTVLLACSV